MSTEPYGEIPDFVVQIWVSERFVGTGILLRHDLVLTAAHCLFPEEKLEDGSFERTGKTGPRFEIRRGESASVNSQKDVLEIKGNFQRDIVLIRIQNSPFVLATQVQLLENITSFEWNSKVCSPDSCSPKAFAIGYRPNNKNDGAEYMNPQVDVQRCPNMNDSGATDFSFKTSLSPGQSGSGVVVPKCDQKGSLVGSLVLGVACLSGIGVNFCTCSGHANILEFLTDKEKPFCKDGLVSTWDEFFAEIGTKETSDRPNLFTELERLLRENATLRDRLTKEYPQNSTSEAAEIARQLVARINKTMIQLNELMDTEPLELARAIQELADVLMPCAIPENYINVQHRPQNGEDRPVYNGPMYLRSPGLSTAMLLDSIVAAAMDRRVQHDRGDLRLIAPESDKPDECVKQILAQLWDKCIRVREGGKKSIDGTDFASKLNVGDPIAQAENEAIRDMLEVDFEQKTPRYLAPLTGRLREEISRKLSGDRKLLLLLFEIPDHDMPNLSKLSKAAQHYEKLRAKM